MAYATTNPPRKIGEGITTGKMWYYTSADVDSDVDATDYFSNGDDLGMVVGDFMFVFDTAGVGSLMIVTTVTAGGAATVAFATVT